MGLTTWAVGEVTSVSVWAGGQHRWWNRPFVTEEIDLLWALVSGVLLLVMAVGMGAVIEGFTRRRTVATGAGRHLVTTAGAIGGSFVAAAARTLSLDGVEFWGLLTVSVLLATIVSGSIVERGTFLAHGAVGLVSGAVVAPAMAWAQADGVLSSITVGDEVFVDAAAATVFAVAGWISLVGIMVIGPRRGRIGVDGQVRIVPGKSMPSAALGALLVLATSVGLVSQPDLVWDDQVITSASLIALSAAVGGLVALGVGWLRLGASSTALVVHGILAGVVSTLGAPLALTVPRALVLGAVGAVLAMLAFAVADRAKIDDPVGIVGVYGVAGVWGTLAAATNGSGVVAQLVGTMVVAAFAVVTAGVLFGLLRAIRLLRISAEVEVVGLET